MRIRVLMENTVLEGFSAELCREHGLSLLIESEHGCILFDTGKSGRFAENAQKMGVDLEKVDTMILSHGHYDHGGGIPAFLERNHRAVVCIQEKAFEGHYARRGNGTTDDIGISGAFRDHPQVKLLSGDEWIGKTMLLFSSVKGNRLLSGSNRSLLMQGKAGLVRDAFAHEQNLLLLDEGKKILFSGCAHRGIVNIMDRAMELAGGPLDAVLGGFHLSNPGEGGTEPEELVNAVADYLGSFPTRYYTCHCTGLPAFRMLNERLGDQISYIASGSEVVL
jgi:7,8-dihydropterin-6-yl-methyl-4-(beta-D-ribofuranosyl)aminobenzene 5'-phosphate synthase